MIHCHVDGWWPTLRFLPSLPLTRRCWRGTIIKWIQGFLHAFSRQRTLTVKIKSLFVHGNLWISNKEKGGKYQTELSAQVHGRPFMSANHSHIFLLASFNSSSLLKLETVFDGSHTVCFSELSQQRKRRRESAFAHLGHQNKHPADWVAKTTDAYVSQTLSLTVREAVSPRSTCWQSI